MATLVLSAAGSSLGGAFGGALGGLGAATLGRAAGSIAGGLIDQQIFGRGADTVQSGRVESFRLHSSRQGASVPRVFGRMRVGGQMIWSSDILEQVDESRQGGKGGQRVREYSYSVSFAVALAEGRVTRIGRVWADGNEIRLSDYVYRLHKGGENQEADPLIEAIEGEAPAYRGVSYVVFEDLPLGPFGNRIPQLNFEVFREPPVHAGADPDEVAAPLSDLIRGVALSPGSGEFSLDTVPVERNLGRGRTTFENVSTLDERPNIMPALDQLEVEAPNCGAVSLIVSWFGDDLRCGRCAIQPAVEIDEKETSPYLWEVNGVHRSAAQVVSQDEEERPIYGGTPSDASVIRAIQELKRRGQKVMFYPFLLMDVPADNTRTDPWSGEAGQPPFPWRGRITLDRAPGVQGSADKTIGAADEVAAFFGEAAVGDFEPAGETVSYSGPNEWSFRRFILHYAQICAMAGGVDSFCIGSEFRSLTQIRDGASSYPAVDQLAALADDVRQILGPDAKIGYAADWSEYFGHHPQDGTGDVFFHLDPLWASSNIDFVGIDNYLPLADWRYEDGHLDALGGVSSTYSLPYLRGNVAGGEGYDWFYASYADRLTQTRSPIDDTAHGEDWVFRPKDLVNWWSQPHHNRPGGVREAAPTDWIPGSKPIWFTELGCPAVDLGANQPNVFVDPKSSESALPYFSRGVRDDFMQLRYIQAVLSFWGDPANNPSSSAYQGQMIDLDRIFIWTWDARPWPDFPARRSIWSDGANHRLGHWITGRLGAAQLADVVADICLESDLEAFDVSGLYGVVDGMVRQDGETAREALQPLMLTYGFDAVESQGVLRFQHRYGDLCGRLPAGSAVLSAEGGREAALTRRPEGDLPRAVRLSYIDADANYEAGATEAQTAGSASTRIEGAQAPLALDAASAQTVADRWLAEATASREGATYVAGRSTLALEAGDIVELEAEPAGRRYRIERVDELGKREITLTQVETGRFDPIGGAVEPLEPPAVTPAAPLETLILDLPRLNGETEDDAVKFAAFADPWISPAALHRVLSEDEFQQVAVTRRPAVIGETLTDLPVTSADLWTRGTQFDVRIFGGGLASASDLAVLNGANLAALRPPGGHWEMLQFQTAELVGPEHYTLRRLLRGRSGTDGVMAPIPAGSEFVLITPALSVIEGGQSRRGLEVTYRAGPSHRLVTHSSYRESSVITSGVAYRPYRPAHLRAVMNGGDLNVTWIRRTRVDGDGWDGADVPLGESVERYRIRILSGAAELRQEETHAPEFTYSAAQRNADGASGAIAVRVAQYSDRTGYGPDAEVILNV